MTVAPAPESVQAFELALFDVNLVELLAEFSIVPALFSCTDLYSVSKSGLFNLAPSLYLILTLRNLKLLRKRVKR